MNGPPMNGPPNPGPPNPEPAGTGPIPADVMARYVAGAATEAEAIRVEQTLAHDPLARRQLNDAAVPALDGDRLDLAWFGVQAAVDLPRRGWLERLAVRLGLPADVARLMAATPTLRRAWYLSILGALVIGVAAASPNRTDGGSEVLFLTLVALIPIVGVALAYGPGVDPSHEVTVASAMSGLRLVLVRAAAVLAVSIGFGLLGALLIQRREGWMAVAWVLPSFGLSMVCLALTTFVRPKVAAWTVGLAWFVVATTVGNRALDPLVLFRPWGQAVLFMVGVGALGLVVVRRRSFDEARAA